MALSLTKSARLPSIILSEKILYDRIPATAAQRDAACAVLIDGDGWTIAEYIAWINRDSECFALMGADCWAERGITTASALGAVLDAEHDRNMRKEAMYG